MSHTPITTFTTYGFSALKAKIWAFRQMGLAAEVLNHVPGLRFWKMLGSGKGAGFSLSPNWSRYALLCVWEDQSAAAAYFDQSTLSAEFNHYATERWTAYLSVIRAQGKWDGQNPFKPGREPIAAKQQGPIAVLTRGAIHWKRLHRFWWHVPTTSRAIEGAAGVVASIGVGELPFVRQATLSFWESADHMQAFAYRSSAHKEIVQKTRREGWYSEDLFARFVPLHSEGTWDGKNPLAALASSPKRASTHSMSLIE